jgi:hypothetical protein
MGRTRRTSINSNEPRSRSRSRNRFNPLTTARAAEEGYNTENDNHEIDDTFKGYVIPAGENSAYLNPRPLERTDSVGERRHLAGLAQLYDEPELLQRFETASAGSQNSESSIDLRRYKTIHQSPLRFVLYTSDLEIATRFTDKGSIELKHNSNHSVPLTVVYLNRNDIHERSPVRADIIRRLPQSVQYLSETFREGQFINSITLDHYFLLTIEYDNRTRERHDLPSQPPTGPIFGVLCCSEERATVESSIYLDDSGDRLIPFDSHAGDPYIYVHLFTYFSDRTVGYHFFTGSHMLEGLYNLFNPIEGRDGRIIYLEAITVQATINFYERFGMERLKQMRLTSNNPINPPISVYFDPFKGFVVPDEIPYVLYQESQIRDAAGVAKGTRQARGNANAQRVEAGIDPSTLRQVSPVEARQIEEAVFEFLLQRARRDPRGNA